MIETSYLSYSRWSTARRSGLSLIIVVVVLSACGSGKQQARLDQEISQTNNKHTVEPNILHIDGFELMGTLTRIKMGSESTDEFSTIWKDFESHHDRIRRHSSDRCYYGASFGTEQEGFIDYMAAMAVQKVDSAPEGLVLRSVPGGVFAVFSCPAQGIGQTYRHIFGEWLVTSGFELDVSTPSFEKYPPADDTASPVLIHIPIRQVQR